MGVVAARGGVIWSWRVLTLGPAGVWFVCEVVIVFVGRVEPGPERVGTVSFVLWVAQAGVFVFDAGRAHGTLAGTSRLASTACQAAGERELAGKDLFFFRWVC